jgi:small subunit ribosomal protein S16
MLKIKLTRLGKKAEPRYRIVVNEARDKRDGAYVAKLGHYQPTRQPKELVLDIAAYDEWLKKGAKPTDTVAFLADIARAGKGFPEGKAKLSKKAKEKLAAEAKAKEEAEAAAKEAAEAKKAETEKPAEPVAETTEVAAE